MYGWILLYLDQIQSDQKGNMNAHLIRGGWEEDPY